MLGGRAGAQERVRAERSLLPATMEKELRPHSRVQTMFRVTAQFADAITFDPARTPDRHLAFGLGVHFCPGERSAAQGEGGVRW